MTDILITREGIEVAGALQLTWEEIDKRRNRFRFENSVLVKVGFSYGRVSDMYDYQIMDKDVWANIKEVMTGKTAWFSDFAGKHSETSVTYWDNVVVEEITDQAAIIEFYDLHGYSDSNLKIVYDGLYLLIEEGEIQELDSRYVSTADPEEEEG